MNIEMRLGKECYFMNEEARQEFIHAVTASKHKELAKLIHNFYMSRQKGMC